jgi:DNA/RNA-binding domain of Phe-tRNA-synthetase-like protein
MLTEIAVAQSVSDQLNGTHVFGQRFALTPTTFVDLKPDWLRLHAAWRGKKRADIENDPVVRAYREFNRRLGLDPSQTPPSVQGIVQRFLIANVFTRFPTINPVVDAVNVAAVETKIPLGVFDAARVAGTILLDRSSGGEHFHPIGGSVTSLAPGRVILRDEEKVLSQFCYRDADAQKVTSDTRQIWLLGCQVPGITRDQVTDAISRAIDVLSRGHLMEPC